MVSKAVLKSRRIRIVSKPGPAAMMRSLVIFEVAVSVLWRGRSQTGTVHKGYCGKDESGVE